MGERSVRVQYIDVARGLAMLSIIAGHLGNSTINRVVFTFHVPIFFLITGYFLKPNNTVKEFIAKKARTLLIPYVFTCLVITAIGTAIGFLKGNPIEELVKWIYASIYAAGDTYYEPFYISGIGAIWFLWATFWGSVILRVLLEYKRGTQFFFVGVLALLGYFSTKLFWFPLSIQAGTCALLYMYIGYLWNGLKEYIDLLPNWIKFGLFVLSIFIWVSFIFDFKSFWLVHCDYGNGLYDIFRSLCACYAVINISKLICLINDKVTAVLKYIGKNSIVLLCIHIVELNLLPWWNIANQVVSISYTYKLFFILLIKYALDLATMYAITKTKYISKVFGI